MCMYVLSDHINNKPCWHTERRFQLLNAKEQERAGKFTGRYKGNVVCRSTELYTRKHSEQQIQIHIFLNGLGNFLLLWQQGKETMLMLAFF